MVPSSEEHDRSLREDIERAVTRDVVGMRGGGDDTAAEESVLQSNVITDEAATEENVETALAEENSDGESTEMSDEERTETKEEE